MLYNRLLNGVRIAGTAALLLLSFGCKGVHVEAGTYSPGDDHGSINGSVVVGDEAVVGDLDSVNGSIRLGAGATAEELDTVNGGVDLAAGSSARSVETVNGAVRGDENVRVSGDVETVNGGISLLRGSAVDGSVSSVNGAVDLDGVTIGHDVTTYNGSIRLTGGTVVDGDLRVKRPRGFSLGDSRPPKVIIGAGVEVKGELIFDREVRLSVHESALIGPVRGAEVERYSGADPS